MRKDSEAAFLAPPSAELIQAVMPMSRFQFDLETKIFSFDRNYGPMQGLPPVATQTFDEVLAVLPANDQFYFRLFIERIQKGFTAQFRKVVKAQRPNGKCRWFEWIAASGSQGLESNRILEGVVVDISERMKELPEVSEKEKWFKEVLEESPHAMYRIDIVRDRFDYVSRGFAEALGQTREELLTMSYSEFAARIHPEELAEIRRQYQDKMNRHTSGRITLYVEFRFRQKSGEYIWLDDTFTVVPGPDGQIAYQVGFGSVIEQRKLLEEQLRKAHDELEERVRERTSELSAANAQLQSMISERRELEKKLLQISERERRFIGRELHDGLCQQIAGVMCMSDAVHLKLRHKKVPEQNDLAMIRDFLHVAVQQTRTLARGLCPLALEPNEIGLALSNLATQTSFLYKIDCRYDGLAKFSVPDADAALHLYRISQEAIQNGIRHGGAKRVTIRLSADPGQLTLVVENDGRALPARALPGKKPGARDRGAGHPEIAESGIGLKLINYRADLLGGSWNIANGSKGRGVRLRLCIPYSSAERSKEGDGESGFTLRGETRRMQRKTSKGRKP